MAIRHVARPKLAVIRMVNEAGGHTETNPGTDWAEIAAFNLRTYLDWRRSHGFNPKSARIIATAQGNEAGVKRIGIRHIATGTMLCEVEWSGVGINRAMFSRWKEHPLRYRPVNSLVAVVVRGSSATEDITIYSVDLQMRFS